MLRTAGIAAALAAATFLATPTVSSAQGFGARIGDGEFSVQIGPDRRGPDRHFDRDRRPDRLSDREIRRIVRSAGYREIRIVDEGRRSYRVRAEDRRGRDYILTVSAYSGSIIDRDRIGGRR
jgi:hypothetical protein